MLVEDREIDIFVGTKIGSFKHIKYHSDSSQNSKKKIENLVDVKSLEKGDGFTCMCWGDDEQTEIVIGRENQQIQTYSTLTSDITETLTSPGPLAGVGRGVNGLLSATQDGVVTLWGKEKEDFNVGTSVRCMRVCEQDRCFYAVGSKEFDIKLYNVESQSPVFSSKNVRHDWLDMQRYVDCVDLVHVTPGTELAVVSPLGYIRLYDVRAQRRPVCEVIPTEKLSPTTINHGLHQREVLVGFNRGHLHLVDFRNKRLDKGYKGAVGAVSSVSIASVGRPSVVSVSLDRHIRVHDYNTKDCLYKQYLTSKLSCLLVQSASHTPLKNQTDVECTPEEVHRDDLDDVFHSMETISDGRSKKRSLSQPSTDGATDIDTTQEDKDTAIVRLLRSTEKKKRRTEKQKREKKKKSVFYNA